MRVRIALVLVALLSWAPTAFADGKGKAAKDKAAAHFTRGVSLYQEGAFRAALVEFLRAMEEAPDFRLQYNIAQTQMELGDYLAATRAFEEYISGGGASIPPQRRQEVERDLKVIRERIGQIAVTANLDGLVVTVDDEKLGETPMDGTIPVNVGRHRVQVRHSSGATESRMIDVAGGDVVEVHLEVVPPETGVVVEQRGWSLERKLGLAGVAAAVVLGGTAVTTGVLAKGKADEHSDLLQQIPANRSLIEDRKQSAERLGLVTDILAATAVLAAVGGTVFWVLGSKRTTTEDSEASNAARPEVAVGPASIQLKWEL